MKFVMLTESNHHFAHVWTSTMKMKMNCVNHVHTTVQTVLIPPTVTNVLKTESVYHTVLAQLVLTKLKDKLSAHLVNTHVPPVLDLHKTV